MRDESDISMRRLLPEEGPTRDERRLMRLLAEGHTDEVAAEKLDWSRRTLDRRLRSSMEKLGANSRLQAGVLLVQAGWLPDVADVTEARKPANDTSRTRPGTGQTDSSSTTT